MDTRKRAERVGGRVRGGANSGVMWIRIMKAGVWVKGRVIIEMWVCVFKRTCEPDEN